ncbi:MAG: IS1595 family transposase [Gammaproteobacteria bacterium]|nr:IS1595 family transposase [Gammaproteobacteria bacterium]
MAVIEYDARGRGHNESGKRIAETISVVQLFRLFPDEDACYAWLEDARWQGRPVCPHCGGLDNIRAPAPSKPRHYWHKDCRKHFTVTTGTCMHSTKRPLQDWIYAIYSVLTARKGVSAMQLSKELGVQYRTAWHMLHRIREACGRGDFTLSRIVEADETHIGGKESNKHEAKKLKAGRGAVGKETVTGIRERGGKVKARHVERQDARTLIGFVEASVEPGATVYTDDAAAYGALPTMLNQYEHETVAHSRGEYVRGAAHTNGIESVWAVLKRSITGTWHHVSPKHLGRYVNEATFRLNEGNCEVDTLDRMREYAAGVGGKRLSYRDLVADNGLSRQVVPA